jgi:hypothetical protein
VKLERSIESNRTRDRRECRRSRPGNQFRIGSRSSRRRSREPRPAFSRGPSPDRAISRPSSRPSTPERRPYPFRIFRSSETANRTTPRRTSRAGRTRWRQPGSRRRRRWLRLRRPRARSRRSRRSPRRESRSRARPL